MLYPDTYTVPNYEEYAFSDAFPSGATHHHTFQTPTDVYAKVWGSGPPSPGYYRAAHDAAIMWRNVGGDWADLNDVAQGNAPFASFVVTPAGGWYGVDILNLVTIWLSGKKRNAGLWLRGKSSNVAYFDSRFALDPTLRPVLRLTTKSAGVVDIACGRSIGINGSTESSLVGAAVLRAQANYEHSLLWFNIKNYALADVVSAELRVHGSSNANQTVEVYRIVNPADQDGDHGSAISPQTGGIASKYPNDVGIENDPSVLFVQKFDPDYEKRWLLPGYDTVTGQAPSGGVRVTAPDPTDGFVPLNGAPAWKFTLSKDVGFSIYFSPWRGPPAPGPYRLKPYVETDHVFLRYYVFLPAFGPAPWNPQPDGGKFAFGVDCRYSQIASALLPPALRCPQLLGMGSANSGSQSSGYNGASSRMHFDVMPSAGDPLAATRGIGSGDLYQADMTNAYGDDKPWLNHYLSSLRLGTWHCVELEYGFNSVTHPDQHPRQIVSLTQVGGVATAILAQPETDPLYAVGVPWMTQGLYTYYGHPLYAGDHPITKIIDNRTFQFNVPANAPAVAAAGMAGNINCWIATSPSRGNFDGILRGWIDGRLACEYTTLRFRHSMFRPDGGLFGVDALWGACFDGGDPAKTIGQFSLYLSNIVFGTQRIGPMLIAGTDTMPPAVPTADLATSILWS